MYALLILAVLGCHAPTAAPVSAPATAAVAAPDYAAIVAAPDRAEADRALDDGRHPAQMLAFFGIAPGQRVAELGAGGGYTAELLARTVGPTGVVYGQNSPFILERFAEAPWTERLAKPVNANVVRVDAPFDAPLPGVTDLDAVLLVLFYHDTVWMEVDRTVMNAAIFASLKPGGVFGVIDHSARAGAGLQDVQTLHRIERAVVESEVLAAGFVLDATSDLLANPDDPRDWNASPRSAGEARGTSDRFVLRFRKP